MFNQYEGISIPIYDVKTAPHPHLLEISQLRSCMSFDHHIERGDFHSGNADIFRFELHRPSTPCAWDPSYRKYLRLSELEHLSLEDLLIDSNRRAWLCQ